MDDMFQISLIGQPNVGKSSLFSRLTGVGVIASNYPGTTVEFDEATMTVGERTLHFHDVPGTYSLSVNSDDEKVVVDMLRDEHNDVIVLVADATNLESSLVLAIEVAELGMPMIVALNKWDIASKRMQIDTDKLSKILGVPFIPVSSRTGEGVDVLLDAISDGKAKVSDYQVLYDGHLLKYVDDIRASHPDIEWGRAVKMLEGLETFIDDQGMKERLSDMRREFKEIHGEDINVHIARDRYGDAHIIAMNVEEHIEHDFSRKEKFAEMTINPSTGFPILIAVLAATFCIVIFAGGFLAEVVDTLYTDLVGTAIIDFGRSIGGELGEAIFTGIDGSISAILGLVIPYIMVFYIILGILEDSGYLPRAVVLLDRLMHKIGLHGNGFIPVMVGFGCNVPAILATRVVRSKRERRILCTIICMAIPCSAQLAIMTGVTGKYAGTVWVFVILAVLFALAISMGVLLNKRLKYEPSNLAMELPEMQWPKPVSVLKKMWMRTSDFFKIAVPLLIIGSIIIEILIHYNMLNPIVEPMSWLTVGLLGLPAVTIIAFIAGILRKEMAYGMLVILAGSMAITDFMTPHQFIVFGVVMSIYMPCLATITAMHREMGPKDTAIIALSSVVVAVIIGSIFNGILNIIM